MENRMPEQIEVTYEMLATKKKRFINTIADTAVVLLLYLFALLTIVLLYKLADIDGPMFWLKHSNKLETYLMFSSIGFVYYFICESFVGGTVGKFITHTKVLTEEGILPSYKDIIIRSLVRMIPLEGFSFIGEYSRGWHDRLSNTVVVDIHQYEKELYHQKYLLATGNNKSVA